MENIIREIESFIDHADAVVLEQLANEKTKEKLQVAIDKNRAKIDAESDALDIVANAVEILRAVSDDSVQQSYKFIADSINSALERIFQRERRIVLKEFQRGIYPQLEIELHCENGVVRSLKDDSGHGIMQIISLLCILSVITINGDRRVLVLDEALSGLSAKSRAIIDDILWAFTDIGFQFIISEHGYIPRGSKVYQLKASGGVSKVVNEYIEENGVYLDGVNIDNDKYESSAVIGKGQIISI